VSQQSFEATEEEVDTEVESMTGDAGEQADALRQLFSEPGRRDSIRRVLVNRKAIEHLTTIAGAGGAAKKAPAKRASRAKSTTAAKPSRSRGKKPNGSDS
jgi:FKBP-type peptidyl-prolyl cis-trans isomerase (trigger factor)